MKNGGRTLKRTLVGSAMLLMLSMVSSATPVFTCDQITTLSQLIAQGSCQHQDKIFANFSYTDFGTADPLANVLAHHEFTASSGGTTDIHGWSFTLVNSGSWTDGFNLSYNVAVDINPADPSCATAPANTNCSAPNQRIYLIKDQINTGSNPNTSQMNDIETVTNPAGQSFTLNTNGTGTPPANFETGQALFSPLAISLTTNSTYTPGSGGQLASYEQQWFEKSNTAVPEPATLVLMGLGLLGVGLLGRKKLKR